MKRDIEDAIGYFEATYVEKFDIDLFNKSITLKIKTDDNGKPEYHTIIFQGISAFYFSSNGPGERKFYAPIWDDFMELSSVGYYKSPKDHITRIFDKPGTSQYNSNPNFNLEIWSSIFLIEANEVVIDDVVYPAR